MGKVRVAMAQHSPHNGALPSGKTCISASNVGFSHHARDGSSACSHTQEHHSLLLPWRIHLQA